MALDKLPLELLRLVANYLTTPEYGKLRLTCTAIEKLCFDDWAKEFFTTRQFAMTRFSLQNLLDISNDVALRPYLQRIIISNECVDCRLHAHHHSHLPDDPIGVLQYEKLMSHRRNEQYFETTGTDCKMLTEALSNLKRFQSLELRDYYSRFNGGRTRDNTTWKSYGATTFENETGRDLQSHHHAMSSIFTKVIAAAQAAKVQIAKLVASPRHSPNFLKLESSAFHVSCPLVRSEPFKVELQTHLLRSGPM